MQLFYEVAIVYELQCDSYGNAWFLEKKKSKHESSFLNPKYFLKL